MHQHYNYAATSQTLLNDAKLENEQLAWTDASNNTAFDCKMKHALAPPSRITLTDLRSCGCFRHCHCMAQCCRTQTQAWCPTVYVSKWLKADDACFTGKYINYWQMPLSLSSTFIETFPAALLNVAFLPPSYVMENN